MSNNKNQVENAIFPTGEKAPEAFKKYFTGDSYLKMLVPFDSLLKNSIGNVTFEPGCRNNWHKHPGGQILLVTAGRGWYQEEGKPTQELHPGDVVEILPNVKHWHGAAADSWFAHLAINPDTTAGLPEWLEPVTDEEYNNLK
jgi:quercetin dioxygenase-like cupin family protein